MKRPVLLAILDGFGISDKKEGNAVKLGNNFFIDRLLSSFPNTILDASGTSVGLPDGQMGNSEVGHMNIGAGRVVYQPLELINQSIVDGSFYNNIKFIEVIDHCRQNKSRLHLMGLISDGGVHSHINHLMALIDLCKKEDFRDIYIHLFTDGRDVSPVSSYSYISKVIQKLEDVGFGSISSVGGRYYGMDRDNNYDRLKKGYDAIVRGLPVCDLSIKEYIDSNYKAGITDEFLVPMCFNKEGIIRENDGVIAFNFRKDRLREILTAITNKDFNDMEVVRFNNVKTVSMMPVVNSVKAEHAYDDCVLDNILGEYLEKCGLSQLRIAETEKYAHVTFFFDGGKEVDYRNEDKILIPSFKVATYDMKPEMSAYLITEKLLKVMGDYDFIVLNFANGDMVGHTGVLDAAIEAVGVLNECLEKIYNKLEELGGMMVITADHGNCETMIDSNGEVLTSHTSNYVPFIVTKNGIRLHKGKLSDIAPTILELMGLKKPIEMTGNSLIEK